MEQKKKEIQVRLAIIGGGPAGLAAALAASKAGCRDMLILERDGVLGGILNQCIHNGFGLHTFQEELTGPEYAARFVEQVEKEQIPCKLHTMVVDIQEKEGRKEIIAMNGTDGLFTVQADAVILAMGCRERPRGALNIPGFRPAGVYSAGTAQRLVNIEGQMPGKEVVILGSGDIGLIMARRMTLEGAKVKAVAELMPYSGGLKRNIVQCLDDYGIPLKLSTTVVKIHGKERVTGVTLAKVDENRAPIPGTEEYISCDTLLLSVGLVPENELSRQMGVEMSGRTNGPVVNESMETSIPGVFACGNVLHVHDLVDYVSQEAAMAGEAAAAYLREMEERESGKAVNAKSASEVQIPGESFIPVTAEGDVRYTVPAMIRPEKTAAETLIRFRVGAVRKDCFVCVYLDEKRILRKKKRILAPGEMEQVILKKEELMKRPETKRIRICIEEA